MRPVLRQRWLVRIDTGDQNVPIIRVLIVGRNRWRTIECLYEAGCLSDHLLHMRSRVQHDSDGKNQRAREYDNTEHTTHYLSRLREEWRRPSPHACSRVARRPERKQPTRRGAQQVGPRTFLKRSSGHTTRRSNSPLHVQAIKTVSVFAIRAQPAHYATLRKWQKRPRIRPVPRLWRLCAAVWIEPVCCTK
jgi:hypothetical protein